MSRSGLLRALVLLGAVLVLATGLVGSAVLVTADELTTHRAPVLVAGPAVVAETVASELNALPGEPLDATWVTDPDEVTSAVEDGRVVAAVAIDLAGTNDTAVLNPHADATLNAALVDQIEAIESARDRTVTIEYAARADAPGHGAAATVRLVTLLAALWGGGFVVVVSLIRGPMAASVRRGARRVAGLLVWSLGGAVALQLIPATGLAGEPIALAAFTVGFAFTVGVLALAFEAIGGLLGLVLAGSALVLLVAPMIAGISPYLLPPGWATVWPWLPDGAAVQGLAMVSYLDPDGWVRPALVLSAATGTALLLLLSARALHTGPSATPAPHWRVRVLATTLPVALVLVLGILVLVPSQSIEVGPVPSVATETECVRGVREPTSVADLNRQISTARGHPAFLGSDVGADVSLQDGRLLLVFGDTLRGESFGGPPVVRNSMMLWGADCVSVVVPSSRGALIPDRPDGVGYWPMSSTVAHRLGYDLVIVSAQRVATTGPGSFDFANLGPALAVFVVPTGDTPQLVSVLDVGRDDADPGRPEWGAALANDREWLYLYGTARPDQGEPTGHSLRVARVHPEEVLQPGRWEYWETMPTALPRSSAPRTASRRPSACSAKGAGGSR